MTPEELSKKIRRLEIRTRREVTEALAGDYKSAFRGSGMEFDEVREYQPGDEVRQIDWNVTARQGRPFVKRFQEERELTVFLAVDVSASMRAAACAELASELTATLAFSAVKSNDKAGLLLYSDRVERFLPPRKGAPHAMRILHDVLGCQPAARGTGLGAALEQIGRVLRHRAVVFILSDFLGGGDYDQTLRRLALRHDVIALVLDDADEGRLPAEGLVEFEDAESGERRLVDCSSPAVRRAYAAAVLRRRADLDLRLRRLGADFLHLTTGSDYLPTLAAYLRHRHG